MQSSPQIQKAERMKSSNAQQGQALRADGQ